MAALWRKCGLLTLLALSAQAFALELPDFPITAWWPPPGQATDIEAYKAAHFNTLLLPAEAGSGHDLEVASRLEVPVLLLNPQANYSGPAAWRELAEGRTSALGWVLETSGDAESLRRVRELLAQAKEVDPERKYIVFLMPEDKQNPFAAQWKTVLEMGASVVGYRKFVFAESAAQDDGEFFGILLQAREAALESNSALWGAVQSTKHGPFRQASESDLRLQVYSYLAAGARGLCYFSYWGPSAAERAEGQSYAGWGEAMIDPATHQAQYGWLKAQAINKEVLTIAPVLMGLRGTGMYFVGDVPEGGEELPFDKLPIARVTAERALVAFFDDADKQTWVMLVNRRHGMQRSAAGQKSTLLVRVGEDVSDIVEIDRYNAFEKTIAIVDRQFVITLPGGTGSLLRLTMDSSVADVPRQ